MIMQVLTKQSLPQKETESSDDLLKGNKMTLMTQGLRRPLTLSDVSTRKQPLN